MYVSLPVFEFTEDLLPRSFRANDVCVGKSSDMPQEMVQEAVEIVTMSVDKFINVKNYEVRGYSLFLFTRARFASGRM